MLFRLSTFGKDEFFTVRLCSNEAAYDVNPRKRVLLDLSKLKDCSSEGIEVILQTRPIAVLKLAGRIEATVARNGRLVIRHVKDEHDASEIAENLYSVLQRLGSIRYINW